jgi:hypothetical protein
MKGDAVPDSDHISRYCKGTQVNSDGTINGTAFRLRDTQHGPEQYLSVNWLEDLDKPNRPAEIDEIRRVLDTKLNITSSAKIAILGVGEMRRYVSEESEDGRLLQVLHEPEVPLDPSHCGIYGLTLDDDLIADLISDVVQEIYPAR